MASSSRVQLVAGVRVEETTAGVYEWSMSLGEAGGPRVWQWRKRQLGHLYFCGKYMMELSGRTLSYVVGLTVGYEMQMGKREAS